MTANYQNINAKSVANYVLLPGIIPRAKELVGSGFGYLAFLFASVYRAVRILPPNHPFTNPDNIGKFGMVQVIAAAANNVQVNRRNIDQIIVFLAMLAAVILVALQFILLILAMLTGRAFADTGGAPFKSMFVTENPGHDIAFLMLDYVFGIPGSGGGTNSFFGSNALIETNGPTPFQHGVHALFEFYNLAILLVAVLIFLYFVFVVVMETAQTGVPFGQRFSKLYAPFRLIAAIGLLVPLNYGFNGAQYITLYAAKIGSSFATNGWILFNENVSNPIGADNKALVAKPHTPPTDELQFFASVYHACREAYALNKYKDNDNKKDGVCINAYVIANGKAQPFVENKGSVCSSGSGGSSEYSYTEAKKAFGSSEMEIVLGELDPDKHKSFAGGVRPYCGRMTIPMNNDNPINYNASDSGAAGESAAPTSDSSSLPTGIRAIEHMYYATVQGMLRGPNQTTRNVPGTGNTESVTTPANRWSAFGERSAWVHMVAADTYSCHNSNMLQDAGQCSDSWEPSGATFVKIMEAQQTSLRIRSHAAYTQYREGLDNALPEELKKRGWGGAGIWYNTIADINGVFTSTLYATPSVKAYPEVMEYIKKQKQIQNTNSEICAMFEPNIGNNQAVKFDSAGDHAIALSTNAVYKYFACGKLKQDTANTTPAPSSSSSSEGGMCRESYAIGSTGQGEPTAGVFINIVSLIFGMNGLFDIRCNSQADPTTGQPRIHPLAQLSTVGRSLVENSIRSMGMAIGASFGSGIAGMLAPSLGPALQSVSSMFVGIATIGLTAGFILYYILPFLPFIYFFFAVGSWVKSVFEAMVGVPLWALAHLRIDGDGFSGRAASGGYFLILEIMLRPIVTVFGLIGGMAIFGALAVGLNELFALVTSNITGVAPGGESTSEINTGTIESLRRGVIDQFFFTIMYAILLYMMATSSFKMIDNVPKAVMRWIGSGVQTFNDNKGDPTLGLTQYAAVGGSQISGQVLEGINQGASAVGKIPSSLSEMVK